MRSTALWVGSAGLACAMVAGSVVSASATAGIDYPVPAGWVTDTARVLPAAGVTRLDGELASFSARAGDQIAVAVVPSLQGESVEEYAYALFNRWGVGQRGRDNGVLLLVSSRDRELRVEVGRGLTKQLSDSRAQAAVAVMTGPLHRGDFVDGLIAGERSVRADLGDTELAAGGNPTPAQFGGGQAMTADGTDGNGKWWGLGFLVLVLAGLAVAWRSMHGWQRAPGAVGIGHRGWLTYNGGYGGGYGAGTGGSSSGFGGGSTGGGGASGSF